VVRARHLGRIVLVALRGTVGAAEWWDDMHWDLVPFTQVPDGGKVARGFLEIYATYGTMAPGQPQGARASATFAADVAQAAASGLEAGLDAALPAVICGHSLGGALATLLVADLTANTPLKPQAWTFASPRVGDAAFAGRYGGLSTVSWRIYTKPTSCRTSRSIPPAATSLSPPGTRSILWGRRSGACVVPTR
jgi:triacylglycerol lipase